MHPETLRQYELLRAKRGPTDIEAILSGPHHFHVSSSLVRVAEETMKAEARAQGPGGQLVFPASGRLPAASMVLTAQPEKKNLDGVSVLRQRESEVVVYAVGDGEVYTVGSYFPGTPNLREASTGKNHWRELLRISLIISLINEPRIVDASPASGLDWSRPHRKAVQRVTGKAAMAFSVVSWKIGRRQRAISTHLTEEGHPKALHWCRAHWRRAVEGQPKAEWVNIPHKGGWGWYCWAADCWKGHPDYGVKLQRHEPYLEGEPRSRFSGSDQVLDATRFAAMGSAHRAAMVEAGFAPSRSLH